MLKSYSKTFIISITAVLINVHIIIGQIKNTVVNGLVFEHFENDLNVIQRHVTALLHDSNGFIWMGTFNGVNVYDGKHFKFYKDYYNENRGFKGQHINSIFEDSKGRILIGTRGSGLNIFMPESGEFINHNEELFQNAKSTFINSISENSNGEIFIAGNQSIITIKLNDKGEIINQTVFNPKLEESEHIKQGLFYSNHYLIVTNKRIILKEGETTVLSSENIKHCKLRYNNVWVLSENKLVKLDVKTRTFESIEYDSPEPDITTSDFEFVLPNMVFIGTSKGALQIELDANFKAMRTDALKIREATRNDKIIIVGVSYIFKDRNDNLYFNLRGTRGGLMKLNKDQLNYQYIGLPEPYKNYFMASAFHDSYGLYWSGTPYGLFAFDSNKNEFQKFSNDSILTFQGYDFIRFVEDNNGQLWIFSTLGLLNYDRKNNDFKLYKIAAGSTSTYYPNFFLDNRDNLWYPTRKGVSKINTNTKETTDYNIGEPTAIYLDKYNVLWVNLQSQGLFSYDISKDNIEIINTYEEFFSTLNSTFFYTPVRDIKSDNNDRLWLTGNNGIYVYDYHNRKIVKHINRNNLLTDDVLFEIMKDLNGNFWVKQLNTQAFCIDAETFEITERLPNWMSTIPDLRGNSGPIYQDKDGKIFTNGLDGYFIYHPESLKTDSLPPRVVLTDIKINGLSKYSNFIGTQNLNLDNLKYNKNSIQLGIKEVVQSNSPYKEFAYRLKGVTENWQFTKDLHELNFNELQPNLYSLEVKSTNNGNYWSNPVVLASFKIVPPWWKTIYAYSTYALILGVLLYSFYRIQLNRKLAESETQKLKEVDEFKNKFFQNITHEFRTPLTVINGMAENIDKKTSTIIKRSTDQLLRLVNELLEIGKIESNTSKLNITNQDIIQFVRYCLESLESLALKKSINVRFNSNQDVQFLDFDSEKIQLVMNNLISNAIKFTPENGKITVSVEVAVDFVTISIKDTGPGIPPKDLDRIFDRYFHTNIKGASAGTGIGLALSREIIKLMNGSISAKNNDEAGACFTVKLPLINNRLNALVHTPNSAYDVDRTDSENIILVIEDNIDVLNYIVSILENSYTVFSAPNGKIGYEKAIELVPDLIISDVMMPVMDGYEACSLIKSDFKTNHIPIILLTAKADIDSKISGLKSGADVYLGKPFNKKELLTHINNLIAIRESLKIKFSQILDKDVIQKPEVTNEFIDKIVQLLMGNLSDGSFGIENLCREIGVSRAQLHRKLKALTGLSTSIFIREVRLREGYKMLKDTDLSVSEVAYSVGFNDPNYFSKLFSEKFQMLPSNFKN